MSYSFKRNAPAILQLRRQCNELWPQRSKANDGMLGDARHQQRKSDHNPNSAGVVTAVDITHDPRNGCHAGEVAESIRASRDPRVKYIIWNRRIMSGEGQSEPAWKWRKYTGENPHDRHVHVSVRGPAKFWDDTSAWAVQPRAADPTEPEVVERPLLKLGSKGEAVEYVQHALGVTEDGRFGPQTELAVEEFQRKRKMPVDGIVGPYTWAAIDEEAKRGQQAEG